MDSPNTSESPRSSQGSIAVEGDILKYKNLTAPTQSAIMRRVNENRKVTGATPNLMMTEGLSIPEAIKVVQEKIAQTHIKMATLSPEELSISQMWNENYKLAVAYYSDASLEEIISNYATTHEIDNFSSISWKNSELEQRMYDLLWEHNPELKTRHDGFNKISRIRESQKQLQQELAELQQTNPKTPNSLDRIDAIESILQRDAGKPWMHIFSLGKSGMQLSVYTKDQKDEWLQDMYSIDALWKVTLVTTLTQNRWQVTNLLENTRTNAIDSLEPLFNNLNSIAIKAIKKAQG